MSSKAFKNAIQKRSREEDEAAHPSQESVELTQIVSETTRHIHAWETAVKLYGVQYTGEKQQLTAMLASLNEVAGNMTAYVSGNPAALTKSWALFVGINGFYISNNEVHMRGVSVNSAGTLQNVIVGWRKKLSDIQSITSIPVAFGAFGRMVDRNGWIEFSIEAASFCSTVRYNPIYIPAPGARAMIECGLGHLRLAQMRGQGVVPIVLGMVVDVAERKMNSVADTRMIRTVVANVGGVVARFKQYPMKGYDIPTADIAVGSIYGFMGFHQSVLQNVPQEGEFISQGFCSILPMHVMRTIAMSQAMTDMLDLQVRIEELKAMKAPLESERVNVVSAVSAREAPGF